MKVSEVFYTGGESLTANRVFGVPYERDGLTVIPAATIAGGAGGGIGRDEKGQEGEGGGFGLSARPTGAYVIKDGEVRWQPAVDVNRIVAAIAWAAVVLLLRKPGGLRRPWSSR